MTGKEVLEFLSNHEELEERAQQGISQFSKGNLEEAKLLLEESLEISPNSILTRTYAGCSFVA